MKLKDKVAIITGGSKGIGYGIAEEYLKEGAKITICSRNEEEGRKAQEKLSNLGEVLYIQTDVSSIEENQKLVDETVENMESWIFLLPMQASMIRKNTLSGYYRRTV